MGIFQSRPEEPTEWAGLPSEPWEPREPAEALPPATPGLDVFGGTGASIQIDLDGAGPQTTAETAADADGD